MNNPLKVSKDILTNLNEAFISTTEHGDVNLNSDGELLADQDRITTLDENTKQFYKNGIEYMNKFDNLEKKEHDNINDLKIVAPNDKNMTLIDPSYIRERDFDDDKKYINVSFVHDFINAPKDERPSGQNNCHGKRYNFTYKDGDKKKNYEYINATNEYYITKNVEEKMTNTGITRENFFSDNKILLYEDGINKWSDKSRYLYFVDKEKQNDGLKKKNKFKDIRLNDALVVDNFEKVVYKQDPSSDKVKIENLILDVLNNDFDYDLESDESIRPNEQHKEEIEENQLNIKKKMKKEPLNISSKNNTKYNRSYILDYLHYDNFFHDEDVNFSVNFTSDNSDYDTNEEKKNTYLKYTIGNNKEFEIKNNVHNLLTKAKNDLNVRDFSRFIPEQFNMNVFFSDQSMSEEYESDSDENMNCVLKKKKTQWNEKRIKEEMELLRKYDYVDSHYSPGYYTRITQNLRDKLDKKRINIYDLKKNEMYEKIKKDLIDEEQTKKDEENLQNLRLGKLRDPDENLSAHEEMDLDSIQGISDREMVTNADVEDIEHKSKDDGEYKTDSSLTFDNIDSKSISNLKRKYKALKKSDRADELNLRKLKFYICRKVNKKKYFLKNMKSNKMDRKKENIRKTIKFSKQGGYNLLAKIQEDANMDEVEEEDELQQLQEDDLFDYSNLDTSEMNTSDYTYSSLTISSYEYLNIRGVHYNDNSYEKIFYHNDPRVNVTYLFDIVQFFLIRDGKDNEEERTSKGNMFIEILVYDIKFYQHRKHIKEEAIMHSVEINEDTTVKLEKKENDISEILLRTVNAEGGIFRCCIEGEKNKMSTIFNCLYKRISLFMYVKHLNSISYGVIENAVNYFLFEGKILNLKNVQYNKIADNIIFSCSKNVANIYSINLSNRKMNIKDVSEFLTFSNIKHCNSLNLTHNPLFLELAFEKIKNDIDCVIKFFKSLKLKELILDFIDLSNPSAEYFIANILLSTNVSFISLVSCELNNTNIISIVNIVQHRKRDRRYTSTINYVNVEFNKLTYHDIVSLVKILFELNKNFQKLYICGNYVQSDIFDISFEFKRKKSTIEMQKYVKSNSDIFHFDTMDQVKNSYVCNLQGVAELYEQDKNTPVQVTFELYFCYLHIIKPEEKMYTIRNISIVKKGNISIVAIEALFNNKGVKIKLNLFKENISLLFHSIVRESFMGKVYYNEQIRNDREVNENVLNYFIMRSENEINLYNYNITREEIHFVLDLCKNSVVKNINLSWCYLRNEDILYFNSVKNYSYGIKVYKLSLSSNLIDSDVDMEDLITFLSNFTIFFKINLSVLKIGSNPSICELFFYLLNNTKCKIISLDNCDLGNAFLLSVNRNINKLKTNNYLTLLSMQYNTFNDKRGMIKFLNSIILACKSLENIKLYTNYISDEDTKIITKHVIKKDVVSFQCTYDASVYASDQVIKVEKIAKNKINNDVEYNADMTEEELKIIQHFFEKKQKEKEANRAGTADDRDANEKDAYEKDADKRGAYEKTDRDQFVNRYNLDDLKSSKIKNIIMK
ncbi:hypothetical protein, conserved [Plasmodium gonderi]|uniref:Leucine-rich repeat protein n=1 Tax=Plasmodium gonderi TaxID=77519 RepID=A0A1Y1JM63_PLAGO|nr:hypothetical protein, conserved [Plasmodium gonderi]GAW82555.1 hypothetical protein, conserved [Plasmodium gonderi]